MDRAKKVYRRLLGKKPKKYAYSPTGSLPPSPIEGRSPGLSRRSSSLKRSRMSLNRMWRRSKRLRKNLQKVQRRLTTVNPLFLQVLSRFFRGQPHPCCVRRGQVYLPQWIHFRCVNAKWWLYRWCKCSTCAVFLQIPLVTPKRDFHCQPSVQKAQIGRKVPKKCQIKQQSRFTLFGPCSQKWQT